MPELSDYELQRAAGEIDTAPPPRRASGPWLLVAFLVERLTGAQKHLLRMGPRNVRIIKEKLRGIALALGIPPGELPPE
jgi:hypothetical protein